MKNPSLYFGIAALLIGLGIFSCRDHRADVDAMDASSPEKIAEVPLKRNAAPGRPVTTPVLEAAGPKGTFSEFQKLTADTLDRLPRTEDVRRNSRGDVHFNPPELMDASPSLGRIATTLRESPELIPQGIDFYRDCARRDDTLTAIRVLCLRHLRFWVKQQPEITEVDPRDYPEDLWKLAESLPPVVR